MPEALRLESLRIARPAAAVIGPVDLALGQGELLALVGPNGAGKSSVVRAILGLTRYEGRCFVGGRDVRELDVLARARRIAWVPQRSVLDAPLTAREVVAMARFAHGASTDTRHESVERALAATRIEALAERPFPALSVGEQRRVLLSRAIASEAPLLLLDEPDAAFDVAHRLMLLRLLDELRASGRAIVLVAHGLDELRRVADVCVLLDRGRMVASGRADEVLSHANVRRVFGVEVRPGTADGYALPEDA